MTTQPVVDVVFKRELPDGTYLFERNGTYFKLSAADINKLGQLIDGVPHD